LPAPFRPLLVEDNDVYRDALGFVLEQRDDFSVVGSVAEGSSAAGACVELAADVAVVDHRLPDLAGPDVAAEDPGARSSRLGGLPQRLCERREHEAARIAGVALVRKDEGVEALVAAVHAAIKESGDAADD
jgi:DNA-binding NarL/FixJ family response regulator